MPTTHHGFYKPDPDDGPFDPGGDLVRIADDMDLKLVKIIYSATEPTVGLREGDIWIEVAP